MKYACAVAVRRLTCSALVALPLIAVAARAQEKATVVYASGNQIVAKNASTDLSYGYTLGAGDTLKTDAGSVPVAGVKPGMVITDGLKGGTVVDDASVVSGKVVSLAPPSKLVVKVGGEAKEISMTPESIAGIKVGDSVDLTLVTVRTAGDNRPMASVKAPAMAGKLAFFQEPNMEQPDSATNLPTYGVAGAVLLALGFGWSLRRRIA